MIPESLMIGMLREWRCGSCGHEHHGAPSVGCDWRWCPKCGSSSMRKYGVVAIDELLAIGAELNDLRQKNRSAQSLRIRTVLRWIRGRA